MVCNSPHLAGTAVNNNVDRSRVVQAEHRIYRRAGDLTMTTWHVLRRWGLRDGCHWRAASLCPLCSGASSYGEDSEHHCPFRTAKQAQITRRYLLGQSRARGRASPDPPSSVLFDTPRGQPLVELRAIKSGVLNQKIGWKTDDVVKKIHNLQVGPVVASASRRPSAP